MYNSPRQASWLWLLLVCLSLLALLGACRRDDVIIPSVGYRVTEPNPSARTFQGLYILNEGTMGRNLATIDFFDYTRGEYRRNLFAERNPSVARELGDVGNDLQIYRGKLWAVINNSNLIEVMDARTLKHIALISVANARYITFGGDYAYISSYAGPVGIDQNARQGKVIKVDVSNCRIVGECLVGYQPEELAIVGNKLYVANSGGYRRPAYDDRLSVIDLSSFSLIKHIPIAINLHRLRVDSRRQLWISSRGNYRDVLSDLYVFDPTTEQASSLGIACSDMAIVGDDLYAYGSRSTEVKAPAEFVQLHIPTRQIKRSNFLQGLSTQTSFRPYGIAVNPELGHIFVADAGDYASPGRILCFSNRGELLWSTSAGVIPSRFVWAIQPLQETAHTSDDPLAYPVGQNPYAHRLLVYHPAPGQFVNKMPHYTVGDDAEAMRRKAEQTICPQRRGAIPGLITLGAWGGYAVLAFDHRVENKPGLCDIRILGNTFEGGSEPGVVYVAQDKNGNGYPDEDEWYRIKGSGEAVEQESFYRKLLNQGGDMALYHDYVVRYTRPTAEPKPIDDETLPYISWQDNKGKSGYLDKNSYNSQSYYPLWLGAGTLEFRGLRLPTNVQRSSGANSTSEFFVGHAFAYGYADNAPNTDKASAIDIDWAVDKAGNPARLSGIDFVKVQTGVLSNNGRLGETSTELSGILDLHLSTMEI